MDGPFFRFRDYLPIAPDFQAFLPVSPPLFSANCGGPPRYSGLSEGQLGGGGRQILLSPVVKKNPVSGHLVKKTYLTLVYLTVVSANKIKGFVPEKNRFREAVKIWLLLPKWLNERAFLRQTGAVDGISISSANQACKRRATECPPCQGAGLSGGVSVSNAR